MEQLIVTIKNGKVEIEVEGAKGLRCLQLTRAIEQLLGEVNTRLFTQDFRNNIEAEQRIYIKRDGV